MPINPASLRKSADTLQAQIDRKRNPAIAQQNLTARRARIASNMSAEANKLERLQGVLRAVADAVETGMLPDSLKGMKSKSLLALLLDWGSLPNDNGWCANLRAQFIAAGLDSEAKFKQAKADIAKMIAPPSEKTPQQRIKEIERELLGVKIAGFFPTPRTLADKLVELAEIEEGMRVLEPSAGNGNIADSLSSYGKIGCSLSIDVIEINQRLVDILEAKGYRVVAHEFLSYSTEIGYDRIVMNPPFENGQDIEHVRHAFSLLKPGGRLVAIVGEGAFTTSFKRCVEFRSWLDRHDGTVEKLPAGSFTGKEAMRQTSVAARIVVLEAPTEIEVFERSRSAQDGAYA